MSIVFGQSKLQVGGHYAGVAEGCGRTFFASLFFPQYRLILESIDSLNSHIKVVDKRYRGKLPLHLLKKYLLFLLEDSPHLRNQILPLLLRNLFNHLINSTLYVRIYLLGAVRECLLD